VLLSGLALAGITLLAVRAWKRAPYLTVGWLWYAGVLFPVSGFVQAGHQAMADRFTYVPLIGVFIVAAWGAHDLLRRFPRRKLASQGLGVMVVAAYALAAHHQVRYWRSELVLWRHALEAVPESYVAHTNLGIALHESGEASDAIPHYQAALRLRPDFSEARNNLAVALANAGNVDGAIEEFREAARYDPDQPAVHYNLAVLLARRGETAEAIQRLREALRLDPRYSDARAELERLTRQQEPPG
jgi:tetratricopeptide (TPR) repeat protein